MGVSNRVMVAFLCDACGREIVAEEGQTIDGYYLEALQVRGGEQVSEENIYACSEVCLEKAVRDGLKRAAMPEPQKISATAELWEQGRSYRIHPELPILDMSDETRRIGTAQEIRDYRPPSPKTRSLEP